VESIRLARKALESGKLVTIFPEGSITRTGNINPFKRGMEKVLDGLDVPVIPVHLDRLWGHFFSFRGGAFFKGSLRLRYPVTITFGKPLPKGIPAAEARQVIVEMGSAAAELRKTPGDTLPRRFLKMARRKWGKLALADSTGREVTYGRAAIGAVLLAGEIRRRVPEPMVGLLLPSSVGGALANYGVTLAGKVAVNLNFTAGKDGMAHAMKECGIKTVLTSKVFLAKAKMEAPPGAVYLEDLIGEFSGAQKLVAMLKARFWPISWLSPATDPDALATVVFSSGSTGVPKGVMLSHFNLTSNIDSMLEAYALTDEDRIIGVLPFFHSFGFTVTLWLPIVQGCAAVYHPNPIEAKPIGDLIQKYKGTFLLATPTFSGTYVRKCTKEQFASLRFTMVGAEKLREVQRIEYQQTFNKELTEGYGCTEMAPVVAANTASYIDQQEKQIGSKNGTVGLPLPGIAAKIVDPETRAPKAFGEEGLLLVRGPNRMLGYLNQPERTADVFHEGWYITGDLAAIDEDGFIRITDRLSRFSKIGGEMVPHLKIEDVVQELTGYPCAVAGIPDDRKGESLVALYTAPDVSPEEVWKRLSATDLPKLFIPKREAIFQVEALPVLGTGKLDLRGVKARAMELMQAAGR
jgi:acyl-[acyl-carrier-protein]-phospholipid O-acyltransferase/long-chain-fatty-acid--[acyl-carrier-protein] ligase